MTEKELRAAIDALDPASENFDAELRKLTNELEKSKLARSMPVEIDPVAASIQARESTAVPVPAIVQDLAAKRTDTEDGMEYRKAFMGHILRGDAIPAELRADATTKTTDVSVAIPTVIVARIIEKMESTGMILSRVNRTSFASGVNIPTSSVKPTATWVAEGAGSDAQKTSLGTISFSHHKLRCEIAITMETSVMTIAAFETFFVAQVSKAMVKSIETAIISGTGTGQPTGILKDAAPTGQALDYDASYAGLVAAEAALPMEYEAGAEWCMSKKTFMSYVGMVDANKQPIARVTYGIGGAPERTLLGRNVVLTNYLKNSADATAGDIVAFIFNFEDYTLNTVYDMGISRRQDWDTEDLQTKAVMSMDGKPIDKNSLVTLKKPAAASGG